MVATRPFLCWSRYPTPLDLAADCQTSHTNGGHKSVPVLESSSYIPLQYEDHTITRKITVTNSHTKMRVAHVHNGASTKKKSPSKADTGTWLCGLATTSNIILLTPEPMSLITPIYSRFKFQAAYRFNHHTASLRISHIWHGELLLIVIYVDSIEAITVASYLMAPNLTEAERERSVLIQYMTHDGDRRRICFLVDSTFSRERLLQALTAFWLENRQEEIL